MPGVHADLGEKAPGLQVCEAVLDGGAFTVEQAVCFLLRVGEAVVAGGLAAGDDHRVVGVVVQADGAEVGQGSESGLAQMAGDLVVAGGGDLAGAAGLGRGDPDQVALLVGQREKQQAMGFVLAGEVLPVVHPGATASTDEGAVQQDHGSAAAGDLLQRPVQTRGPHSQELDRFLHPATHGGGGDGVAAGHVGKALVVAEYGEHDDRLGARGELAPAGAQLLAPLAYQAGDEIDGPLRQREANLVNSFLRALGGAVGLHTRANSRRGPSCYGRNRPVHRRSGRSAREITARAGPGDPAPVGELA